MARRSEEYARLNDGGGYTQALTVGKGFSGAERMAAKQGGSRATGTSGGGGGGGTMNAYARHLQLIRNYHRYAVCVCVCVCVCVVYVQGSSNASP